MKLFFLTAALTVLATSMQQVSADAVDDAIADMIVAQITNSDTITPDVSIPDLLPIDVTEMDIAAAAVPANDIKTIVDLHNKYRTKHHAPNLAWNTTLATFAQNWSDRCVFEHSRGAYGENLGLGYANWTTVIDAWYNEVKNYNYSKPGFGGNTGHFTQVVWKSTTQIGCGVQTCNNRKLYTCSYSPYGNIVGFNNDPKYFVANVLKP